MVTKSKARAATAAASAAPWVLLAMACATIAMVRWRVAAVCRSVKDTSDVFALPSVDVLPAASLGYRAALADLIFSHMLVQYGIHGQEHRRFDLVGAYLESIVALDPEFCTVYRYADTFIIFQATGTPTPDDVRRARRLVETGLANCPDDGYLWLTAGQFMAFIGVQFLKEESEIQEYRQSGARTLARAAELASANENLQWQSLAAAGILSRDGKLDAAIEFLKRVEAVTDSEELREKVRQERRAVEKEKYDDAVRKHAEAFAALWRADLPFASRTRLLVLGPPWNPAECSGRRTRATSRAKCPTEWSEWAAQPR